MLAITCNLDPDTTKLHHPQGVDEALSEICRTVRKFGFEFQQNSLYLCQNNDLANLSEAMTALKKLPWLADSVLEIRAFRVEQWSDFTSFIKR